MQGKTAFTVAVSPECVGLRWEDTSPFTIHTSNSKQQCNHYSLFIDVGSVAQKDVNILTKVLVSGKMKIRLQSV